MKVDLGYMANLLGAISSHLFYEEAWPDVLLVRPDEYDWAVENFDDGILIIDGHHIRFERGEE